MTEERKTELLEKCTEWVIGHISDAGERFEALTGRIGFTLDELHEFGIDDLDDFFAKEQDHRKKVIESIEKEYSLFRERLIKDGESAFNSAHEISVKTEFYCALYGDVEFGDKIYEALYQDKGEILQELYTAFIDKPGASVNTYADTEEFIEGYCEQKYPEIMDGEEDLNMG